MFYLKKEKEKKGKEVIPIILCSICEVMYTISWLICLFVHDLGRALLHFLDPDKFKSKDDFVQNYKNLSSFNEIELANLHKELRPHILTRVIKDVEKSLPPKIDRFLGLRCHRYRNSITNGSWKGIFKT